MAPSRLHPVDQHAVERPDLGGGQPDARGRRASDAPSARSPSAARRRSGPPGAPWCAAPDRRTCGRARAPPRGAPRPRDRAAAPPPRARLRAALRAGRCACSATLFSLVVADPRRGLGHCGSTSTLTLTPRLAASGPTASTAAPTAAIAARRSVDLSTSWLRGSAPQPEQRRRPEHARARRVDPIAQGACGGERLARLGRRADDPDQRPVRRIAQRLAASELVGEEPLGVVAGRKRDRPRRRRERLDEHAARPRRRAPRGPQAG